jgi:predicted CXXCH cytochrome family protein
MRAGLPRGKVVFPLKSREPYAVRAEQLLAGKMLRILLFTVLCSVRGTSALSADMPSAEILFPKADSLVGGKVNLVLDPAADLSAIPFFQAVVNKRIEYPVVDTSTGKHASQGLALDQGMNTITVRFIVPVKDSNNRATLKTVATRDIRVYNGEGSFAGLPAGFSPDLFHTREREATCTGCHRMEVAKEDVDHRKPEDVLCYQCHRSIPTGRYRHGPAAVWNCIGCHNPEMYPVKYQFASLEPWHVTKTIQSDGLLLYSLSTAELFEPDSAVIRSVGRAKEMLKDALDYLKMNPSSEVRIEAHSDGAVYTAQGKVNGGNRGITDNPALTQAQADAIGTLFKEATTVPAKNIVAVGMGNTLPKVLAVTKENRDLNDRIEVVVHPSDVKVKNSRDLPVLKDRQQVVINLTYAQGPQVRKLSVVEHLPRGVQYIRGSAYFKGKSNEPRIRADELAWDLGDMDANFSESLFYVVTKKENAGPMPVVTKLTYVAGSKEVIRDFDGKASAKQGLTVKRTCLKCHGEIAARTFKHGPADAGYCNLCHDPHASSQAAWLRKSVWDLCTTCHTEKASGVHVVAGFVTGQTHPTRLKPDPMRPGKRLTCASCHDPHGAEDKYLFVYETGSRSELCKKCHLKK